MASSNLLLFATVTILLCLAPAIHGASQCNVVAHTHAGKICGLRRRAENGAEYASFRGIPYAKQPLGELRFKELQPVEPWDHVLDTVIEGPVCPQINTLFGPTFQPNSMGEDCIRVNVHVPIQALPGRVKHHKKPLPILVFIHGGGFSSGSGDSDLYGPEYIISQDVVFITFNYRVNVFGFLSLNSSSIPGNNGLRDQITLLRWVRQNALAFGGNPDDVTLMGQSGGASFAHILSLSKPARGLFKRYILMSGEADRMFATALPQYAHDIAKKFLQLVGINNTDPEVIHNELVAMPLDQIMKANEQLHTELISVVFAPVVESEFPGVTRVLDDTPSALIDQGRGAHLPLLIGVTNKECESVKARFQIFDVLQRIEEYPKTVLTGDMIYSLPSLEADEVAHGIIEKYLPNNSFEDLILYCTTSRFWYAAYSLAQRRAKMGSPAYLYQFAYTGVNNTLKFVLNATYEGAGHIEDMTYVLRTNSVLGPEVSTSPPDDDDRMVTLMTSFIRNFVYCSDPTCGGSDGTSWPKTDADNLTYHYIESPSSHYSKPLTEEQKEDVLEYFNVIYDSFPPIPPVYEGPLSWL